MTVLVVTLGSCSHSFDGDTLDLRMYQWNLWIEPEASTGEKDDQILSAPGSVSPELLPSCGWEKLHRGMGKLVRIPAAITEYYSVSDGAADQEAGASGIAWYHCRFSLPELWEERPISLEFEEAGPRVDVFLNETYVGGHSGSHAAFSLDVSNTIYRTRDNHLAIRISDPEGEDGGITGSIQAKPGEVPDSAGPG